jgi:hypothetical protein
MTTGDIAYNTLDSLSAFWPGLQVLAGDVESAIKSHMLCEDHLETPFQLLIKFRLAVVEAICRHPRGLGHELSASNLPAVPVTPW